MTTASPRRAKPSPAVRTGWLRNSVQPRGSLPPVSQQLRDFGHLHQGPGNVGPGVGRTLGKPLLMGATPVGHEAESFLEADAL